MPALAVYEVSPGSLPRRFAVRETTAVTPPKPRLLDRVRAALRAGHYSRRTGEAYVAWITPGAIEAVPWEELRARLYQR